MRFIEREETEGSVYVISSYSDTAGDFYIFSRIFDECKNDLKDPNYVLKFRYKNIEFIFTLKEGSCWGKLFTEKQLICLQKSFYKGAQL